MKQRPFRLRPKNRSHSPRPKPIYRPRERPSSNDQLRRDQLRRLEDRGRKERSRVGLPEAVALSRRVQRVPAVRTPHTPFLPNNPPAQSVTFERIREILADKGIRPNVCKARYERTQVLFAKGIAGARGKSPGKGGTYKRTPASTESCERSL